jgi:hypothetical protein
MDQVNRMKIVVFICLCVLFLVPFMNWADSDKTMDNTLDSETIIEEEKDEPDWEHMDPAFNLAIGTTGGILFPLGSYIDQIEPYALSNLHLYWNLKSVNHFLLRFDLDFYPMIVEIPISNLVLNFGAAVCPTLHFNFHKGFSFVTSVGIGTAFAYGTSNPLDMGQFVIYPYMKTDAGIEYELERIPLYFYLSGQVIWTIDLQRSLASMGIIAGIGFRIFDQSILAQRRQGIQVESIELKSLYGALYAKYNELPIGSITIKNSTERSLEHINVDFFVSTYMDNPKTSQSIPELKAGQSLEVDLFAVFNQKVLGITEDNLVLSKITVHYEDRGKDKELVLSKEVLLHNRNAMTWTDFKKLGSFVTLNDEPVRAFARGVKNLLQTLKPTIQESVVAAAEIYTALTQYGIQYIADPNTPFAKFSQNAEMIDTINYPRETLLYKSGDCDDLTLLYCALL